jgi:hypothetical protein
LIAGDKLSPLTVHAHKNSKAVDLKHHLTLHKAVSTNMGLTSKLFLETLFLLVLTLLAGSQVCGDLPTELFWGTPEQSFLMRTQDNVNHIEYSDVLDRPPYYYERRNLTFTIDVVYAAAQDGVSTIDNGGEKGGVPSCIVNFKPRFFYNSETGVHTGMILI